MRVRCGELKMPNIKIFCVVCKPASITNTIHCPTYQQKSNWLTLFEDAPEDILEDADKCVIHGYKNLEVHE